MREQSEIYQSICEGRRCFIIAEAGVNHNGEMELARKLVDSAVRAGADAVKFQTWKTEKLVAPSAPMAEYQIRNVGSQETQFEMVKKLELSYDDFRTLKRYCGDKGIIFLSTPDEEESADFLASLDVPLFKVGSGELTNLPFLKHIASKGKPVILSTGMGTLGEVESAVETMESAGNKSLTLLHCVSDYPAEPKDCNLRAMLTLKAAFNYPVGFSDHTIGMETALAAVAMGASVIEKHITLDQKLPGPDHNFALEPDGLKRLVESIRLVESALGTREKRPTNSELETRKVVRKRIFAGREIPRGKKISPDDLTFYRASEGLEVKFIQLITGCEAVRIIKAGEPIKMGDIG